MRRRSWPPISACEVTLVDDEPRLGGVCLLRGCIPSKALLHVAKVMTEAKQLADWGVGFAAADDRPRRGPRAKRAGHRHAHRRAGPTGQATQGPRDPRPGDVRGLVRRSLLAPVGDEPLEDDRVRFEHCILATGSSPTRDPGARVCRRDRVMDSTGGAGTARRARVAPGRRRRLHRPGDGHGLRRAGQPRVGRRNDRRPAARRRPRPGQTAGQTARDATSRRSGSNTKVVSLDDKKDAIEVTFDGRPEQKVQRFSRVLVSVGRRPNSAGLGLENTQGRSQRAGLRRRRPPAPDRRPADPGHRRRGRRADARPQGRPRGQGGRRGVCGQGGDVRAPGDSRRRLHRSGDRLGRPDRNRGQGCKAARSTSPSSPGPPAAGRRPSAAPRA